MQRKDSVIVIWVTGNVYPDSMRAHVQGKFKYLHLKYKISLHLHELVISQRNKSINTQQYMTILTETDEKKLPQSDIVDTVITLIAFLITGSAHSHIASLWNKFNIQ